MDVTPPNPPATPSPPSEVKVHHRGFCVSSNRTALYSPLILAVSSVPPLDHLSVLELKAVNLNIDRYLLIVAPKLRIKATSTVDVVSTSGKVVRFKACKLGSFGYGLEEFRYVCLLGDLNMPRN